MFILSVALLPDLFDLLFLEYGWTTLADWSRLNRLHVLLTECRRKKTVDVLTNVDVELEQNVTTYISLHSMMMLLYNNIDESVLPLRS